MNEIARRWRTPATSVAAATVGVFGFAGAIASAEPVLPLPPQPGPSAVSQTAPLTPTAALTPAAPNAALAVPQLARPTGCGGRGSRAGARWHRHAAGRARTAHRHRWHHAGHRRAR